jgi:hypothetical protein
VKSPLGARWQKLFIDMKERPFKEFTYPSKFIYSKDLLSKEDLYNVIPFDIVNLRGLMVGVTGNDPVDELVVGSIAYWQGALLGDLDIWQNNEIIVIGREGFDEGYLKKAIELILSENIYIHFISQGLFLEFLNSGELESHYPGDPRIVEHPGLNYLSTIGFKWPEVGIATGKNKLKNFDGDDHILATRYNYSVRAGVKKYVRRKALKAAVTDLGLEVVVFHIAGLIRMNTRNPFMKKAVPRWQEDLNWLFEEMYKNSLHSFVWPSFV